MLHDFKNDVFDIVIQGGQSNSEGCGIGSLEHPYQQHPEIYMMESDFTIMTAREKVWGNDAVGNYALSFAEKYVYNDNLKSDRKLLILMAAVGGTGFCDHRWGLKDDLFLNMIKMLETALALNPENRPVAFLWHQGETDTQNPVYDIHYNNLSNLVEKVRSVAGCDDLPFIAGNFVPQWYNENKDICIPIVKAIRDVCADIGHAVFVETDGLQSNNEKVGNDDTIHFSREALYYLGYRYYDAFITAGQMNRPLFSNRTDEPSPCLSLSLSQRCIIVK